MSRRVELALEIFQPGPNGKLGNCAEAIFRAFEPDPSERPADERAYRRLAKGRAPEGRCGAYHAGALILARQRPDVLAEFERTFRDHAGCIACRAIKKMRRLRCAACVAAAADYLDQALPPETASRR